jgi:hypothetical protein
VRSVFLGWAVRLLRSCRTFGKSKRWAADLSLSPVSEMEPFVVARVLRAPASQPSRRSKVASLRVQRHGHSEVAFSEEPFVGIISQVVGHLLLVLVELSLTVGRLIASIFLSLRHIHVFEVYSIVALVERPSVRLAEFLIWVA